MVVLIKACLKYTASERWGMRPRQMLILKSAEDVCQSGYSIDPSGMADLATPADMRALTTKFGRSALPVAGYPW